MSVHGQRDIREEPIYKEVERHFTRALEPSFGRVSGATDPQASPDGQRIAFTGTVWKKLEALPPSRIACANVATGDVRLLTNGPNSDKLARWSPDGARLAFVSDRAMAGRFQLFILEPGFGEARPAPEIDGTIESLAWSPAGDRLLLGVAGIGADVAGGQGSGTTGPAEPKLPDWMPAVDTVTPSAHEWRRLWLYDVATHSVRLLTRDGLNVWEACWAGPGSIMAIISERPGEDDWYRAPLAVIDGETGAEQVIMTSSDQLGWPAGSPSGRRVAVVEAFCSDRGVVAGDVLLSDIVGAEPERLDLGGVDVTWLAFRNDDELYFMGQRGLRTVAGVYDCARANVQTIWESEESCGDRYPEASLFPEGALAIVLGSYARCPELAAVSATGEVRTIASLEHDGARYVATIAGHCEVVRWRAPDGLEIEGLLVLPPGPGPHPLLTHVHGGPVWSFRNRWQMGSHIVPLLVSRGFAVFHPNPRGSSGRGPQFARLVSGQMGGDDTQDLIAGVQELVNRGVADPERLGVFGGSYGGFMSSWLVTQTDIFAAAVPQAPVTDWYSQHLTSNIAVFDRLFLDADPYTGGGAYFERSPAFLASRVKTPVLLTAGGLDECTPPTQAIEFHRALREHGVETALAIYPQEGHGVRTFPAVIDQAARVLAWFERFMPAHAAQAAEPRAAART